jgi:hypothetical protein
MTDTTANHLLTIPKNVGRAIIEAGAVIACPLLATEKFVNFCKERNLSIDRERLFRLERLRLFAPVFRLLTPHKDVPLLSIPPHKDNNWFTEGWAWDTTSVEPTYQVPDHKDRTQEGYYSVFQIDYLQIVLAEMTLSVQLDSYLESSIKEMIDWDKNGKRWLELTRLHADSLRTHEYRRAVALLCQFISNRYYPHTQGNQRTIHVSPRHSSDSWTLVNALDWDWYDVVRTWKPHEAERLFELTPSKLCHAYKGLAVSQAYCDPLERWYQLTQFVKFRERERLKGDALRGETLRSGAHMLRLLYKDLYDEELPHPNEVTGKIITPIPELETRKDTRRYLELVVNRYDLNPQPTVSLIVEGASENLAVEAIFEQYFSAHPGKYGIEIIVLGGVDVATGAKEDRFRAIIRLIDYLHHHQTFTFLILDNERYARKLKAEAQKAKSIHGPRYVTRPEYIKVWKRSFEFDNFSCAEIANALSELAVGKGRFSAVQIETCQQSPASGAMLKELYHQRTGKKLDKLRMTALLTERMLSPVSWRTIANRPITKTLERVARLAQRNPFPTMQEIWKENQASKFFGKKINSEQRWRKGVGRRTR